MLRHNTYALYTVQYLQWRQLSANWGACSSPTHSQETTCSGTICTVQYLQQRQLYANWRACSHYLLIHWRQQVQVEFVLYSYNIYGTVPLQQRQLSANQGACSLPTHSLETTCSGTTCTVQYLQQRQLSAINKFPGIVTPKLVNLLVMIPGNSQTMKMGNYNLQVTIPSN